MPKLPSGLQLAISKEHILEPDINWFHAPDGHFWYWIPAEEDPPPFGPYHEQIRQPKHAPVPQSKEEMSKFIQVLIMRDDGMYYWLGDYMYEFPFLMKSLSKEDQVAWKKWLDTDPVQAFLDTAIQECQTQSIINKDATGSVTGVVPNDSDSDWINIEHVVNNPLKGKH